MNGIRKISMFVFAFMALTMVSITYAQDISVEEATRRCQQLYGAQSYPVRYGNQYECITSNGSIPLEGGGSGSSSNSQPQTSRDTANMSVEQIARLCQELYGSQSYPVRREQWECVHGDSRTAIGSASGGSSSNNGGNSPVVQPAPESNSSQCSGGPVNVGDRARVTPGRGNNLRSNHSLNAEVLTVIPALGEFDVVGGPVCQDNYRWFQVSRNGTVGWTVDGNSSGYWIERVNVSQTSNSAENFDLSPSCAAVQSAQLSPRNFEQAATCISQLETLSDEESWNFLQAMWDCGVVNFGPVYDFVKSRGMIANFSSDDVMNCIYGVGQVFYIFE